VGAEFAVLLGVLQTYQALPDGDDGKEGGLAAVKEAARTLSLCVQVTRTQEKDLGVPELLTASHHLLGQVFEQVSALNSRVASLEAQVKRGGCGCSGAKGGGGSGVSQKKGKGKRKMVEVGEESESELSESEVDQGGEVNEGDSEKGGD
jgi:hypothetical protein